MTDLPPGWEWTTIGEIADVLDARRIPVNATERAKRPGSVPYYGATGQVGWIDEALFDEELVLLGEDGAPFLDKSKPKAYVIAGPAWVNNHAHVLRARAECMSNRLLKYLLDTVDYRGHVNGTTRLKLTQKAMRDIRLPLPPRAEQERIVAAIEEHLARLDAAGLSLADAARRIDPLRAALISSAMSATGRMTTLGDLAIDGGITDGPFGSKLKSSHYTSRGPRVIRLENVGVGEFIDVSTHISSSYFIELRRHEACADDVVVASLVSDRLRACLVPKGLGPSIVKADCIRVRLRPGVDPRFVNYALMRPSLESFVARNVRGLGRSRLGLKNVRRIPVPNASPAQQTLIADRLDAQFEELAALGQELKRTRHRRMGLRRGIPRAAFSGKLVPQDPDDEPASVLLERIRAERAFATPKKRARRGTSTSP